MNLPHLLLPAALLILLASCSDKVPTERKEALAELPPVTVQTTVGPLTLPSPYTTKSAVKLSRVVNWAPGTRPLAPDGFAVSRFADGLRHPRHTYVGPDGNVFVVESDTKNSADRISLLTVDAGQVRDRRTFAAGLNQPFGMLIHDGYFYVANTDTTFRFPYRPGQAELDPAARQAVLATPPRGYNNHWTRNLLAGNGKIYVSVGSGSNVGENGMAAEENRATILEINPDGSGAREYATGLRNPVGMDWNPVTGELWTAVNERDKLGDGLVPDYLTSVREGAFYGWPYSYYGQVPDPRWEADPHPELVRSALVPDVPLGAHTASLGLAFYTGERFPERYRGGAFVGQHGSWNRSEFAGYKVVFVPFDAAGKPGPAEDFLAGFIADEAAGKVRGRPVGVTLHPDGYLLVCDDDAGIVWKVDYPAK